MSKTSTFCRQHLLLLLIILCFSCSPLFAQQITWTGHVDSDWATPGNWNTGTVPTASDDVVIDFLSGVPFPNYPEIGANTSAVAHSVMIRFNASLVNNATGEHSLTISSSAQMDPGGPVASFQNSGYFHNKGKLIVNADGGSYGIWNNYSFTNDPEASVSIDNAGSKGWFNNSGGNLFNNGKIVIGAESSVGEVGLHNKSVVHNSGGEIRVENAQTGILHENSAFRNSGLVIIGAASGMSTAGFINNAPELSNQNCGRIIIAQGSFINTGTSSFRNNALLQINGLLDNQGNIENQGILKYGTLSGPGRLQNDGDFAVSFTNSSLPIFSYGGSFGGEISIFTEEAATIPAGTFVAPNTFVPSAVAAGSQTIYARIKPSAECTYIVPFTYERIKMGVKGNGIPIASGATSTSTDDHTDFGSHFRLQTNEVTRTFTIENTGTGTLNLPHNPPVMITGQAFGIKTQPSTALTAGQSTTFEISFVPVPGEFTASVIIPGNDPDADPYTFTIKGIGTESCATVPTPSGEIHWTGLISPEWNNPCNWSPASVPGAGNDVVISKTANRPVIGDNVAALARSIEIKNEVRLSILPQGSLTVNGRKVMSTGVITALYNAGLIENRGKLSVEHGDNADQNALWNAGVLMNALCGQLLVPNGVIVNETGRNISNDGLVVITGSLQNQGTFTNTGVLKYGSLSGTIANETDRFLVVKNGPQPFFVVADNYTGAIEGIFRDAAATVAAGTFTPPNTFVSEGLPAGDQTLYTKITPVPGFCSYIVPIAYTSTPDIRITGNGNPVLNGPHPPLTGNHTDFEFQFAGNGSVSRTFTIESAGTDPLVLIGNPLVSISGSPDFTVTTQPDAVIATRSTFTITFDPSSAGPQSATVSIPNSSLDKNPFNFDIRGRGIADCVDAGEVAGTITWTGFASNEWNNPCNWSPASVPRAANDVVIPGMTQEVFIDGFEVQVNSIDIRDGGVLHISGTGSLTANGTKKFDDATVASLFNSGIVKNSGKLTIGKSDDTETYGLWNNGTFQNSSCASLHVLNNAFVNPGNTFKNDGYVLVHDRLDSKGTFDNNGILKVGRVGHEVQNTNAASVIVEDLSGQIFRFGATYNGTINGIFHDEQATISAGTYVLPDAFTPTGETYVNKILYAKITPASGECAFVVPFRYTYEAAKIVVTGNNVVIPSGQTTPSTGDFTDFGSMYFPTGAVTRSFYIENKGNIDLELSGVPIVAISGSEDFRVTKMPGTPLRKNREEFTIVFDPSSPGVKTAEVTIFNNDINQFRYTFTIRGEGNGNCVTAMAPTGQINWTGAVDSNWHNPCNWSPATIPGPDNQVWLEFAANHPVIEENTEVTVSGIWIFPQIKLIISKGATFTSVGGNMSNFSTSGIVENEGTIDLTKAPRNFTYGIFNDGEFTNKAGGVIKIDRGTTYYIYTDKRFTNSGLITIGANAPQRANTGLYNGNFFENTSTGIITLTNTNTTGLVIHHRFDNSGKIIIHHNGSTRYPAIQTGPRFTNNSCAQIYIVNGFYLSQNSDNPLTNEGLLSIQQGSLKTEQPEKFINNGVLTYTSALSNSFVNGPNSVVINQNVGPVFKYGDAFEGTVAGIFRDSDATQSAGNFTAPNTFTPDGLSPGSTTLLYAKVTMGSCDYVVPFSYLFAPKINVQGNGISIEHRTGTTNVANGTDFGTVYAPYGAAEQDFVIQSVGTADLNLPDNSIVRITGSADFQVVAQPDESTIYGNGELHFRIRFDPSSGGVKNAEVRILSSDPQKPLYFFAIQGAGNDQCAPVSTPSGTIVWTGVKSSDWDDACNWAPNSVPGAGNRVIILGGTPFPAAIASQSNVAILSIEIQNNATLEIADQATLTLTGAQGSFPSSRAFINAGLVKNNGKVVIESPDALGDGLLNEGEFQNNLTGEIQIDHVVDVYLNNPGTFTNAGKITNGTNANSAELAEAFNKGIVNQGTFDNAASGIIVLENNGFAGLVNIATFVNKGQITAGGGRGLGRYAILNDDTFRNEACGTITAKAGAFMNEAEKTMVNEGLILISKDLKNEGIFTNNGVLKYTSLTGAQAVENTSDASVIVNHTPAPDIFSYGGAFNGSIDGIFSDAAATMPVGRFAAPNTFIPSGLVAGNYVFYAKITPNGGACSYIVPFTYNFSGVFAWTGLIDSDWGNVGNWSTETLPGAGQDVQIPAGTPHSAVIMGGTDVVLNTLTIQDKAAVRIASTGRLRVSGYATSAIVNDGNIENEGDLIVDGHARYRSHALTNNGTILNKPGGKINLDFAESIVLRNNGTITNRGEMIISTAYLSYNGIENRGDFTNSAEGKITIVRSINYSLMNIKTFINSGKINIDMPDGGINAIWNTGTMTNEAGAAITIGAMAQFSYYNAGTFNNNGLLAMNSPYNRTTNSFINAGVVNNGLCGKISLSAGRFLNYTSSRLVNNGFIHVTETIDNQGDFDNQGILKFASIMGPNQLITSSNASVIVNDAPAADIFTYGGTYDGVVEGIFSDETLGQSAGTFTAPNTFVPGRVSTGSQTLYAKITPKGSTCAFAVPFSYVSTATLEISWTGTADSDWNNAQNWSSASVPQAHHDVTIPSNTPHSPVINTDIKATVYSLSVQNNAALKIAAAGSLAIGGSVTADGSVEGNVATGFVNRGSFENEGSLTFGSTTEPRFLGILNFGTIANKTGGTVQVDFTEGTQMENHGTVTNAGKWVPGTSPDVRAFRGILNFETFTNAAGGELMMDNVRFAYLYNGKTLTNTGKIEVGSAPSSEDAFAGTGIANEGTLNNEAGGFISIDRLYQSGFYNDGGTINNEGRIVIGLHGNAGQTAFRNTHIFSNSTCGQLAVHRGRFYNRDDGKITNHGFIHIIESIENEGDFDNQGILKFDSNAGSKALTTSSAASVIVNDTPATEIFTFGGDYSGNIDGIFRDKDATLSAGTFTAPGTFAPKDLPKIQQTLYAKISPAGSSCSFIVPFEYFDEAAMPVTLVSFSGKKTGKNENTLKWVTSDETNFDRFEVQRSANANVFETIGTVTGTETRSASIAEYQFIDQNAFAQSYYRLKMIDKDRTFSYSKIITVSSLYSVEEVPVVGSIYPNPAHEKVFADILAVEPGTWTITIFDVAGRTIVRENRALQKGINKIRLENLATGLNLIRFENGGSSVVKKVLKEN